MEFRWTRTEGDKMLLPLAPSLPEESEARCTKSSATSTGHHSSTGGHYLELIAYFIPIKLFRRTKHAMYTSEWERALCVPFGSQSTSWSEMEDEEGCKRKVREKKEIETRTVDRLEENRKERRKRKGRNEIKHGEKTKLKKTRKWKGEKDAIDW